MTQAPDTSRTDHGDAASPIRLEQALAALSEALSILDELRLPSIAGHVSLGYELGRQHLQSLRNGGNSAT